MVSEQASEMGGLGTCQQPMGRKRCKMGRGNQENEVEGEGEGED